MQEIEVTVKLPKETYELALGLVDLALASLQVVKDGFQPGQDIPVIITHAIAKLPPAMEGLSQVPGEWKEKKAAFLQAWIIAGSKLTDQLT